MYPELEWEIFCEIVNKERVVAHYQPIVSIKKKSVIGLEALCRGLHPQDSRIIPPSLLFSMAQDRGLAIDLDRLCRKKSLESFRHILDVNQDMILFVNFDTSIIDCGVVGSNHLINQVRSLEMNPRNIVIEIVESKVNDYKALEQFINTYRGFGFLIALDDIGAGNSNLDRLTLIKPDILKIDRSLVSNLERMPYKKEVVKSLVNLSHNVGALAVAEGIETREEAICALELGADMLQGYYFARPQDIKELVPEELAGSIGSLSEYFRNYRVDKIKNARVLSRKRHRIIEDFTNRLGSLYSPQFNRLLAETVAQYPDIECIYIIDDHGFQISETIFNNQKAVSARNMVFQPSRRGAEHTLKDYYYLLVDAGFTIYTTEPYISLATGNLCITISASFHNVEGQLFILCIDMSPDRGFLLSP